jgi:hypothetical protein
MKEMIFMKIEYVGKELISSDIEIKKFQLKALKKVPKIVLKIVLKRALTKVL